MKTVENIGRVLMLGDSNVGKSTAILSYMNNNYSEAAERKLTEQSVNVTVKNKTQVQLTVRDTAGGSEFDRMRSFEFKNVNVVVICFAFDDPQSFDNIKRKWLPEKTLKQKLSEIPTVIVGLKSDCEHLVTNQQIKDLLNDSELNLSKKNYVEASSKDLKNLDSVFKICAVELLAQMQMSMRDEQPKSFFSKFKMTSTSNNAETAQDVETFKANFM